MKGSSEDARIAKLIVLCILIVLTLVIIMAVFNLRIHLPQCSPESYGCKLF